MQNMNLSPSSLPSGSGAKIKRLSTKQHGMPRPTWVHAGHTSGAKEDCTLEFHPIDSSGSISGVVWSGGLLWTGLNPRTVLD